VGDPLRYVFISLDYVLWILKLGLENCFNCARFVFDRKLFFLWGVPLVPDQVGVEGAHRPDDLLPCFPGLILVQLRGSYQAGYLVSFNGLRAFRFMR